MGSGILGLLLVTLVPMSWYRAVLVTGAVGRGQGIYVVIVDATFSVTSVVEQREFPFRFRIVDWVGDQESSPLWPHYEKMRLPGATYTLFNVPLWMVISLCLAWPVTSFIITRRRLKRGFPVVQPAVRDQKSEVSQIAP